jgi:ligand-binding SRPBCC domain-containing protein
MPLARCWQFFSDPRNLEKITPPSLRLHIESELPSRIYPGLMVQYVVSPIFGIPLRWLTEIIRVDEPHHFIDEQRIGPYRLWHHEHFFRELDKSRVEIRDLIHYAPPFGPLGAILNALVIRRQLGRILDFRARKIAEVSQTTSDNSFT